ncbi:MAG: pilin [Francisellaceae bacterium]|nr:pilin [Francisellaceae bacterium]
MRGFTLIELVMVIILIGILVASTLPRFSNLRAQASLGSTQGIAGSFSAAVNIAHLQWLALSQISSITLEGGQVVRMSSTGWPEDVTTIPNGVATDAKCLEVWNAVLNNPPQAGATTCTGACQYLITGTANTCTFKNIQDGLGMNAITYNILTGAVVAP